MFKYEGTFRLGRPFFIAKNYTSQFRHLVNETLGKCAKKNEFINFRSTSILSSLRNQMNRLNFICIALLLLVATACERDEVTPYNPSLSEYISEHASFEISPVLIACAAGTPSSFMGDTLYPTSVFFYPVEDAYEFRYWETDGPNYDIEDHESFFFKALPDEPVFNGKLWRFKNTAFEGQRWGIVTYKVGSTLHICRAINLKTNVQPTQIAPHLIAVTESGTQPQFQWLDGWYEDNVIYFQMVSDVQGNLISGTYTTDLNWDFYDLSNVVLNIHDVNPSPALLPDSTYSFTLMSVSYDNWVNLMGEIQFTTN